MPAAPSSKGCDACRTQKKKCDQLKPACSRCARLRIICVGAGTQRYVFKTRSTHQRASPEKAISRKSNPNPNPIVVNIPGISPMPTNTTILLTKSFIDKMEVRNLRYDLSFTYGQFLDEIPKRLGSSEVLEAATIAFTRAYQYNIDGIRTHEMMNSYIHAVKTMRLTFDDPLKACSADTFCAIYLMMICESWIGNKEDPQPSHGQIVAYLLETGMFKAWMQGDFELPLLQTLTMAVISESITNPNLRLSPWIITSIMWKDQELTVQGIDKLKEERKIKDDDDRYVGVYLILCMIRVPDYLQDTTLRHEAKNMYPRLVAIAETISRRLDDFSLLSTGPYGGSKPFFTSANSAPMRLLAHYQRMYSQALCMVLIVNFVLRTYDPDDIHLRNDCKLYIEQTIDLSQKASQFRPLGSGHTLLCLAVSFSLATDELTRARILDSMDDYQTQYVFGHIMNHARDLETTFQEYRRKALASVLEECRITESEAFSNFLIEDFPSAVA